VAVGDQDGRGIPVSATVLIGGLYEPLDLPLGEILAAAPANCPASWGTPLDQESESSGEKSPHSWAKPESY
jgi:hypothetical protein